jgi:hypothetical protein
MRAVCAALLLAVGCADPAPARAPVEQPAQPPATDLAEEPDAGTDAAEPEDAFVRPDAWRRPRVAPSAEPGELFDARDDAAVIERLRDEEIVGVERGRGGRSVAFRFTLASGARAYFKPEQSFSGTHWFAEIAAFHLDRLLRVHRTAPSTARVVPYALLEPALVGDARADELIVQPDGTVRGAIIAWIDERLVPIEPPPGWERALRVTDPPAVFPFVAPIELRRAHASRDAGVDAGSLDGAVAALDGGSDAGEPEEDDWDDEARARELSILIAFDFLTQNGDRWGGNYTNVRTRGVGGPIILLDNAAGFWRHRGRISRARAPIAIDARLGFVERFDGAFVRRVRRLSVDELRTRLETEPVGPILDDAQLEYLEERRQALLGHVDAMVAREGEARALPW